MKCSVIIKRRRLCELPFSRRLGSQRVSGADVFVELVQCEESNVAMLREVLVGISGMLHNGSHIFSDEDDQRLVNIVDSMVEELLPHQEITD